jgi:hypothetical protein
LLIGEVHNPGSSGPVGLDRLHPAIVNGQLFKIG